MAKMGKSKLVLIIMVPVLAVVLGGLALVKLHEKYQKQVEAGRAEIVAQYELRRLTASLNFRLNELRSELFHLYNEQVNLARALSEPERERFVFYRRDYLAGFAVLVRNNQGEWNIQKYFLRQPAQKTAVEIFREAAGAMQSSQFWMKQLPAAAVNAPWTAGTAHAEAYAIAFTQNDEVGRPFALVGIYRPSFIFPFCKFFSDSLGEMSTNAFVLDENGRVVCHSQPKYEGVDFKQYKLFEMLSQVGNGENTAVRYANVLGTNVAAFAKRVQPGNFLMVAEAAEVSPWGVPLPYRDLGVVAGIVLFVTLAAGIYVVRFATSDLVTNVPEPPVPAIGERAETTTEIEIGEFTKLKRELKEVETTLLDLQALQAFVAGFQKAAVELPAAEDLGRFAVDHLGRWNLPLVWCPVAEGGKTIGCGAFSGWDKPLEPFEIELGPYEHPSALSNDPDVFMKLSLQLQTEDLAVQPVYYQDRLLGLLVMARPGEKRESLPQIAQIMAFVASARSNKEANAGA